MLAPIASRSSGPGASTVTAAPARATACDSAHHVPGHLAAQPPLQPGGDLARVVVTKDAIGAST